MARTRTCSRRFVLGALAASGGAILLAACGGSATGSSTATSAVSSSASAALVATSAVSSASTTATAQTASAAPSSAAAAPSGKAAEVHLNFRTGSDAEWQQKFIPQFEAQNPTIHLVLDVLPGEPEYWAKVQALYATGQVGDFIWASLGNYKGFAEKGIFAPLDAIISKDKYDMSDYTAPGIDNMKFNGKLFGLPWGAHLQSCAVMYNQDLLDKDGVKIEDATQSFDSLYQAAVKLTKSSGGKRTQFGFVPSSGQTGMLPVVRSFGGEFYDQPGQKLTLDSQQAQDAIKWFQKMWKDASVTFGGGLNTSELFANGQIAMVHAWYGNQFDPGEKAINGKFKWDIVLMPKGPANVIGTQFTINGITMSALTKQQDATWTYMKYMMDPVNQVQIVLNGGGRPAARHSVLNNPDLLSKMKAHKVFVPLYDSAQPWPEPGNHRWPEFNTAVDQVFGPIWTGQSTLEAGMKDVTAKLQEILDKPKA